AWLYLLTQKVVRSLDPPPDPTEAPGDRNAAHPAAPEAAGPRRPPWWVEWFGLVPLTAAWWWSRQKPRLARATAVWRRIRRSGAAASVRWGGRTTPPRSPDAVSSDYASSAGGPPAGAGRVPSSRR
ncbi:MAG: hypothetical protein KM312_13585, partial [Hydrogenibacillus schlegelii]|nr:hypothetical protein [Hydrogenibacillus schlegelii]